MEKLFLFLALLSPLVNAQDFVSIPVLSTSTSKYPVFPLITFPDNPIVKHNELATKLIAVAKKHKEHPKFDDVINIIKVSENLAQKCIPNVFTKEDFISLAWVESAFDPYVIGNAKEVGNWQVLEWRTLLLKVGGTNPFNTETNGEMMCIVLNWKYDKYHNYKKSIQAYNGLFKGYHYFDKVQKFKFEVWPELKPKPKKKVVKAIKIKRTKSK
jgi:hypothetical protein